MDETAREAIIDMLEHDKLWANEVFSNNMAVSVSRLIGAPVPTPLAVFIIDSIRNEQDRDLGIAINLLKDWNTKVPVCFNNDFKFWLTTIIENDADWFVKSAIETDYSRLTAPKKEICDNILRSIDEIKSVPVCHGYS